MTAAAKADLLAIRRYIGADNPTRAVSFVEELLDRCLALADTPRAYPWVPRYERFGSRRCVHGNYLIFLPPAAGADRGHPRPAGRTGYRSTVVRFSLNLCPQ